MMSTEKKQVSIEEVSQYLESKRKYSKLTAVGVMMCIGSAIPLLSLLALVGQNYINMSNKEATAVGLIALFGLIVVAVGIFLRTNLFGFDLEKTNRDKLQLDNGGKRLFAEELDQYKPTYLRRLTFSVVLIVLSVVPLITVAILTDNGWLLLWMVNLMLLLIGFGVFIIVPTSNHYNALRLILEIGDPILEKSKQLKRTEKVAAFYWPLVTAGYVGWSLWTMAWGISWIIWPVAALVFPALIGLIGLFDSYDETGDMY